MEILYQNIDELVEKNTLHSYKKIYRIEKYSSVKRWVIAIVIICVFVMFLPWTQNIKASGSITTLMQENRPQEINTVLSGSIAKWYIKEGDFVKKGDTVLKLGEVKVDYFDPELLDRTKQQLEAKKQSAAGYENKAKTADIQVAAQQEAQILKLSILDNKIKQQQLKIISDSNDVIALSNELSIYKRQLDAGKVMLDSGAISLVDFEKRRANYQNGFAKKISAENKFAQGKQELINYRIEKNSVVQDYVDKISKTEGDKFSSLSNLASTNADISKLQNIYANYDIRNKLYYIIAPQDGQIIKAKKAGIGEFVKEGEMVVEIVPLNKSFAVEMYIEPMDLPLVHIGEKVRFIFDGFPAIVFSGWPNNSFGTFGGKIAAVETNISSNGKFRVLVAEDTTNSEKSWPRNLKLGGGAKGIALLKDVKVGYELWRNINGFPPEYYKPKTDSKLKDEKKK
ncbi:MAG: HlyD family secretion protein [Chitinophagaceae bacterium]